MVIKNVIRAVKKYIGYKFAKVDSCLSTLYNLKQSSSSLDGLRKVLEAVKRFRQIEMGEHDSDIDPFLAGFLVCKELRFRAPADEPELGIMI